MSFLHDLADRLAHPEPLVTEVHGTSLVPADGRVLGDLVRRGRGGLGANGVQPGDRVVLVGPNSIRWVAADLAILFHGAIVVPLYDRQDRTELGAMIADCTPALIVVADDTLLTELAPHTDVPLVAYEDLFAHEPVDASPVRRAPADVVTIIYTSGTSGAAKGVKLTRRNVDFMLPRTERALGAMLVLDGDAPSPERVFHYLPFCFAGSRVVLWTSLLRRAQLHVSTDLDNLGAELKRVDPHYLLNVPMLLERMRTRVETALQERPAVAWLHQRARGTRRRDRLARAVADRFVYPKIREQLGPSLKCLICGSAPLAPDTQRWFHTLGIPVYQVYGLTETTAIVTMDQPPETVPGRVGHALPDVDTRIGEGGELLVRGPNVFEGYWENEDATAAAFTDGWFRTGDQAEVDAEGTWRIIGRVKNLLVPTSGHNVAPEPIEQQLLDAVPTLDHAVLVGHARPYLVALVSGDATAGEIDEALARINAGLPHYKRVRRWARVGALTPENGLLTANRKLRRQVIETHFTDVVEGLYRR